MSAHGDTLGGRTAHRFDCAPLPPAGTGVRAAVGILLLACALVFATVGGTLAQSPTPRAAAHDDFGRMVFDWPGPVTWSAEVANNQLVIRFDKAVAGDPKTLLKPLARYFKTVTVSPDRRLVTFQLAVPVQVKSFVTGTSTVVDISAAAAPAAPTPPAAKTPAAAAEAPTELMVRGGEHTGFNRVVFDWSKPVDYSVNVEGGRVVIGFDRPAKVNLTALQASLPTDVTIVEAKPQGKGTQVVLALPAGMRVRHFTSGGSRVVVDLVRPAGSEPPRAAGAPPPLAPAPGAEGEPAAMQPLAPSAAPTPPVPPPPVKAETAGPASVAVGFDQPSAAAAFRRGGWLWLVFDRKAEIDAKAMLRTGNGTVLHAEPVPAKSGIAVRLLVKPGFNPVPRKEGKMWVFDLLEQPLAPKVAFDLKKQFDFADRGRLVLGSSETAKEPVVFRDPEVGDTIQVVPVMVVGGGVAAGRDMPAAELLPTAQGIALVPHADRVRLDASHANVEVTMPGGVAMSRDDPHAAAPPAQPAKAAHAEPAKAASAPVVTGPLDLANWLQGGPDKFESVHQQLLGAVAATDPASRGPRRIAEARHYLANGMAAEALGVLKIAARFDPAVAETADFRGARGAANFMMGRDGEAIEDLAHPSLANDKHVAVWLAAARAHNGQDPAGQAVVLRQTAQELKGLPPRVRLTLGRVAVETEVAAGDAKSALTVVNAIAGNDLDVREGNALDYLSGLTAQAGKQYDQAIGRYRDAEAGMSRPDRAFAARNRIELQLSLGQITKADAIHQLEHLRFAWRGGDFEYQLLKRLGDLLIADGRYGEGLRLLRLIVDNFPDHPDIHSVNKMMSDTFARLFLDGEADKLSPVAAIGLYDEFQELTPAGDKGDEMIRKLADRLASIDLNDRAADLLSHQVHFRLSGADKARVGARLAVIDLLDHKSGPALEALDSSEVPNLPAELYDQRRFLRVRALADLGRTGEALALIINDQTDTAKDLRAEIYWEMKKWPEAAAALDVVIGQPAPGARNKVAQPMARRILDLATALTLAKDERGLQRLRRSWGAQMDGTAFKEAFDLLTSEPEHGIVDYRKVDDKIKQVEEFQSFMSQWKKRVQAEGLSSVN